MMFAMRAAVIAGVVAVGGCSFDKGGLGNEARDASAIDAPSSTIDASTAIDGPFDASSCTPSCSGDTLSTCDGSGPQTCDLGCVKTPAAHCAQLVPSNGATEADDLTGVTMALDVPGGLLVFPDTDTGAIYSTTDLNSYQTV